MRYDDDFEDDGFRAEGVEQEAEEPRLSRRDLRRKHKLEEKLLRYEEKEARRRGKERTAAAEAIGAAPWDEQPEEEPRKRSRFTEYLMSFLSGNILSRREVSRVYPYLIFVAFLAFLYISNVFAMQGLHRQHSALTREVRELRAKSMDYASMRMRATRQSSIIEEINKRGLTLEESLTPNRVIPK